MEGDQNNTNKMLSLVLPFQKCSNAQIQYEYSSERETLYEKFNNSQFLLDIADHVNSFTTDNYKCNFYDINRFNSTFNSNNDNLKICHLNIRSINLHKHELLAYLTCLNSNFDAILLTECGNALQASIEETFQDYDFYYNPPTTQKGGAAILIRKNTFSNIEILDYNKFLQCTQCNKCQIESFWVKLEAKDRHNIIIGCIYRHPNNNITHFNNMYQMLLQNMNGNATCIIGGDFNIDLLQHERTHPGEYLTTNLENNFTPCITLPTRFTANSATLIDQIFIRLPKRNLQSKIISGNLYCSISDHLMNFVQIDLKAKKPSERPHVRLFTEKNIKLFNEKAKNDFSSLNSALENNNSELNTHQFFTNFLSKYKTLLDKFFPYVRLSRKKSKDKPWITAGIKNSIKQRNCLYKNYIEDRTEYKEQVWKRFRNETTNIIKAAETKS